jgi:hypothetical protein
MDDLAKLMDEAYEACQKGDRARVTAAVGEYRTLYAANVENLR